MKRLFFIGCLAMMAVLFLPISVSADDCSSCYFDISPEPDNITGVDYNVKTSDNIEIGLVIEDSTAANLIETLLIKIDSKSQNEPYLWRNLSLESKQNYLSVKCYNCLRYDKCSDKT